ncbi:MAG: hypothetical protein ACK50T_04350, partial [Sphingobacteriia bacterium]
FYSMQKRALLDDILFVLLQFSNSGHPAYQYLRAYSRGMILLQRQLGEGAREQLEEATGIAAEGGYRHRQRTALVFQGEALMICEKPSFDQFRRIHEELDKIQGELRARNRARSAMQAMQLLYHNHDALPQDQRVQQAAHYLDQVAEYDLTDLKPENLRAIVKILRTRLMYAEMTGTQEENHRFLSAYYQQHAADYSEDRYFKYEVLNLLLSSALKAGDFLSLQGAIYKVTRLLETMDSEVKSRFLPGYLETAGLFYFYEKDLITAQEYFQRLLAIKDLDYEVLNRCIYYRLAILIAANLPRQAKQEAEQYKRRLPALANNPILWVLQVVIALEDHAESGEILLMIERIKIQLRKMKDIRKYQDNLYLIEGLLERKKVKMRASYLFPPHWEQILRIDLLLLAKKQSNFYYNLLTQDWEQRKRVF